MKFQLRYLAAILVLFIATSTLYAADYKVIVNNDVKNASITNSELKNIFLGRMSMWEGNIKIKPAYLKEDVDGAAVFYNGVVAMPAGKFKKIWVKLIFSGYGIEPKSAASIDEIVKYVTSTSGAIAVIPADKPTPTEEFKILTVN